MRVEVFDLLGRAVLVLPSQNVAAGFERAVLVHASALASGVYVYPLRAEAPARSWTTTGRFVLLQ